MDSAIKTSPSSSRATDRVHEALSTLAALLDGTINEVQALDTEFQNRLTQAVQEAEATLQAQAAQQLDVALTDSRKKLEEQFRTKIAELSSQWDEERNRLNAEIGKMTQATAQWEAERSRLNGEVERLARVQAATQAEAEKAIQAMKEAAAAKNSNGVTAAGQALGGEIERVERLVKEITALIEDPTTDLSTVIRKNVERAELESYLRGIRFAISGVKAK
jgi:chromosome segregation ATPase